MQEVTSINISKHGVGFESQHPLPVSGTYLIEIGMGDQRLVSEIRVVACRETNHGNYEVGAEFV